jgi:serine O-acetyltransferase
MFENVMSDLDVYSYRLGLPKWTAPFMVILYPVVYPILIYRFGNWVSSKVDLPLLKHLLFIIYFILKRTSEVFMGIEIAHDAQIGKGFYIAHFGDIVIGNKSKIGEFCSIRNGVTVGGAGRKEKYGHPVIGNGVYFGAGAKVIGKIKVGNNVMIGANAVVVKDVPDNAVVGGGAC